MNELKEALEEFMSSYYAEITHSQYELICNHINNLQFKIDKAIEIIDLITPELWNISNKMTYRLKDVKNILKEDK